jgi:hypothetical protein
VLDAGCATVNRVVNRVVKMQEQAGRHELIGLLLGLLKCKSRQAGMSY